MSGGNDHNTSAGDKYSLPVLHKVQRAALCKVKADTVAKALGLGTGSVTGLAQETSRSCLSEKCLLSLKDFPGWAIFPKSQREAPKLCSGSRGVTSWLEAQIMTSTMAEGPGQWIVVLITLWCSLHGQSRCVSISSLARVNSS